jgi:1-acyl-sn-glycerol-3-phosphate acyltransferase
MVQNHTQVENLRKLIADEFYKAFGIPKKIWWRRFFDPIILNPSFAFADICSRFEKMVENNGFKAAAEWILPHFVQSTTVNGSDVIPYEGPLLIVSNHPGTFDSLVIAANVPRNDLKILAGNIPFLKNLPATQRHLLHTTIDTHDRMMVLRRGLRHLYSGGSLLIFGSGGIDPEPAFMDGAGDEIEKWSPSIGFFMTKVPGIRSLITIVSDVLSPKYFRHPLTLIRKNRRDKQRISEFLQVIQQVLSPGKLLLRPKVSFAEPIHTDEFISNKDPIILRTIIKRARQLLDQHLTNRLNNH